MAPVSPQGPYRLGLPLHSAGAQKKGPLPKRRGRRAEGRVLLAGVCRYLDGVTEGECLTYPHVL